MPLESLTASGIHWGAPEQAWLGLLVLPGALLFWRLRAWQRRAGQALMGEASSGPAWSLLAAAGFFLLVALCRPQWGEEVQQRADPGLDILIALDLSRSMLADDLQPTRLAAAKAAIVRMLPQWRADRLGLIAFAGSAFLVCPLTSDHATFAAVLKESDVHTLPLGGSSLAGALAEARRGYAGSAAHSRHLIVISDGEDHSGEFVAEAAALRASGVRLHAVMVGTPAGGPVLLAGGEFLRDRRGALVRSRAQPAALRSLTDSGRLYDLAADPAALEHLQHAELAGAVRSERGVRQVQRVERYQIPLALALLLFAGAPFVAGRRP